MLEVVCGRRPIEHKANYIQGKIIDVVDARLNGEFDVNQVLIVLKLGLLCSNNFAVTRPKMREIVTKLDYLHNKVHA